MHYQLNYCFLLIENGKRTPSLKRLIIIADVLEVDAYKLLM